MKNTASDTVTSISSFIRVFSQNTSMKLTWLACDHIVGILRIINWEFANTKCNLNDKLC